MSNLEIKSDALIYMKVGQHAGEDFDEILERKKREFERAGMIFWGYGGSTLHPLRQVQPFVRSHISEHGGISLVMESIDSNADPDIVPATSFSIDGINWQDVPEGITVTGSRYALVLGEIRPGDLTLDLTKYQVGVGQSRGKRAEAYIQGRVDKGAFELAETQSEQSSEKPYVRNIAYQANLLDPYAVMLK